MKNAIPGFTTYLSLASAMPANKISLLKHYLLDNSVVKNEVILLKDQSYF